MTKENKVLNLYPIDYPFETLVNRIEDNKLHLDPDFQRVYKWDIDGHERGSKFIESCLMRIPLPACYFAERKDNTHDVIDGVQRITTIQKFFKDEFPLENLSVFRELEGKKFSELGELKSELETTTIRCIILRKDNHKSLVSEIFARLNQGAVQLEPQEIRHAVYPGVLDTLLRELGQTPIIKDFKSPQNTVDTNNGDEDRDSRVQRKKNNRENEEMILRYFALQSDLSDYEGNLTKYLNKFMETNQNISSSDADKLRVDFNSTLEKCLIVFPENQIFRDITNNRSKRGVIYYDLLMWYFRQLSKETISENKEKIRQSFEEFCKSPEFQVTRSSGLQRKDSILRRRAHLKSKLGLLTDE